MSLIRRLFSLKSSEISLREGIQESKESLLRLEVLTRKLNERSKEIKYNEDLLYTISKNIAAPIWAKDPSSRFVFVNKACCDLILHCTEDEALNMQDSDFADNVFARVCMASDRRTEERMETCRFIEHATANGEDMWIVSTKSPWIVAGKLIGTVGTADNITSIVPDDIKERFRNGDFFEIGLDVALCSEKIREIVRK